MTYKGLVLTKCYNDTHDNRTGQDRGYNTSITEWTVYMDGHNQRTYRTAGSHCKQIKTNGRGPAKFLP